MAAKRDSKSERKRSAPAAHPAAEKKPRPKDDRPRSKAVLRGGVAVSPGVAVGKAYCIHDIFLGDESRPLDDAAVLHELARYDAAREKTAADLKAVYKKVFDQLGEHQASIFLAHEAIL